MRKRSETKEDDGSSTGASSGAGGKAMFGRTKQKILAGMGKAEETIDINVEYLLQQFERDGELVKELESAARRYVDNIKAVIETRRRLADEILELYEASHPMYNAALQVRKEEAKDLFIYFIFFFIFLIFKF